MNEDIDQIPQYPDILHTNEDIYLTRLEYKIFYVFSPPRWGNPHHLLAQACEQKDSPEEGNTRRLLHQEDILVIENKKVKSIFERLEEYLMESLL